MLKDVFKQRIKITSEIRRKQNDDHKKKKIIHCSLILSQAKPKNKMFL